MSTLPIEKQLQESESELERAVQPTARPADDTESLSRLLSAFDTLRRAREKLAVRESLRVLENL